MKRKRHTSEQIIARLREALRDPEDDAVRVIRSHTHTGRPLGTDSFLSKLERILGRRVRALPVGRPRKQVGPIPQKPTKSRKKRRKERKNR